MAGARLFVSIGLVLCLCPIGASPLAAQQPAPDGWVVIPVDEYRALRLKAFPPDRPADPPPVEATLTRVEYDLRVNGESAAGEARVTVDVLKQGCVRIDIPAGLLVRAAKADGRVVPVIDAPAPHVLLARPGRTLLSLDIVAPVRAAGGTETISLPASKGAVSRLAGVVPRDGIDLTVAVGVLAERAAGAQGRWVAFGRAGQPLAVSWKRRVDDARAKQALRWRGSVTQVVGLGEEASSIAATVRIEVAQGVAPSLEIALPEGMSVNQVAGPMVADWEARPRALTVTFLEAVALQTSFSITGETRTPRDGSIAVPLVRLAAAERETGGVAVEVLGAGEISTQQARGLEPADASELGEPVADRVSPSMQAFRFRSQPGASERGLTLAVARYTPQAVLVANVEEARYDALIDEEGKALVRARYAVRNNQRAFLGVTLPAGATLWSAALGDRPLRPGSAPDGSLLLPLEKARAGAEAPAFVVELTYVQRAGAWSDRGRAALQLPVVDLPIARSGIALRHSPRFRVTPEPGAFRVAPDLGPFTDALRIGHGEDTAAPAPAAAPPGKAAATTEDLVGRYQREAAGRVVTGPLPVRVPFPHFGAALFLTSELTAELQAASFEFAYKRESRW